MLYFFALASMAAGLLLLIAILSHGRRHVQKSLSLTKESVPSPIMEQRRFPESPKVAVVVPAAGYQEKTRACLESLLCQNYTDYEVIFVTRDLEDPASVPIRELVSSVKGARHIISGPADRCGQKNHNLLAGIGAIQESVKTLVFCDSSHRAPPNLLYKLVTPILEGNAQLTSGFHRIIPEDLKLATLGMLSTVLGINLLQGFDLFSHPWGGATAISRSVFERYGVKRLWARNVVDDFSMGPYLRRFGIRCTPIPGACLETHLGGETLKGWSSWLTRQLLYLKFCVPGAWLAAALPAYLMVVPLVLAGFFIFGGIAGIVSPFMALAGLIYLTLMAVIGIWYRTLTPAEIPLRKWLSAFFVLPIMAGLCYVKTWLTNFISWKGISYKVGWGGKVKYIVFED